MNILKNICCFLQRIDSGLVEYLLLGIRYRLFIPIHLWQVCHQFKISQTRNGSNRVIFLQNFSLKRLLPTTQKYL